MRNLMKTLEVAAMVAAMKDNSNAWLSAVVDTQRDELARANQALGSALRTVHGIPTVYEPETGVWYVGSVGGPRLYDLY